MSYGKHYSVLNKEVITYLTDREIAEPVLFIDFTFGAGGHTFALLEQRDNIYVAGIDQDPEALANGRRLIEEKGLSDRVILFDQNFVSVPNKIEKIKNHFPMGIKLMGIVADLGVSSHHFDTAERGFSFRFDGPLDMRMDSDNDELITAAEVLNTYAEEKIADIIYRYGEERLSRRIAANIVEKRAQEPFKSTKQLENIVFHCYPKRERFKKAHPATRTFQALRLYVNKELEVLEEVIETGFGLLEPGGRFCIITFHSLEDRIVKHQFISLKEKGKILTKKPVKPGKKELEDNKRSRSAKLRVIEKL